MENELSLEERILQECKDKDEEYIAKKGTGSLLALIYGLQKCNGSLTERFVSYLETGKWETPGDWLFIVFPMIFTANHSFETEEVEKKILDVRSDMTATQQKDCLLLYSFLFDLFYETSDSDAVENLEELFMDFTSKKNEEHEKSKYRTFHIVDEYLRCSEDSGSMPVMDNISQEDSAIIAFMKELRNPKEKHVYAEVEPKYREVVSKYIKKVVQDTK